MTETFLEMAIRHRDEDLLAKGEFVWTGKACSIGCFNYDLGQRPGDFAALAEFSGYPEWAHRLQEAVFEGLHFHKAREWHVRFAQACERVTDWVAHYHRTMIAILEITMPHDPSGVVQRVIDLHKRGPDVSKHEWVDARVASWAFEGSAAWTAARAARAGAEAVEAVEAVWDAGAAGAAGAAAWATIADAFCEVRK